MRNTDRAVLDLMRRIGILEAKGDFEGARALRSNLVRKPIYRTYTPNLMSVVKKRTKSV